MQRHSSLVTIANKRGLHARASARFATLANQFPCEVLLGHCDSSQQVNGKNILEVMMLAASPGCQLQLHTCGEQAEEALAVLRQLVLDNFDEDAMPPA